MSLQFASEFVGENSTNLLAFLGLKHRGKPSKTEPSLSGQVAIVTGGNRGIGKGVSVDLASRCCSVVIACRDETSANETINEIKQQFPNSNVAFMKIDVSSFESIKSFVNEFNQKFSKLDILINNAGLISTDRKETIDGHEFVFGINYLGPVLLTSLLIEKLEKSKHPRIINVSSVVYHQGKGFKFGDLNWINRPYDSVMAYAESKFCLMLFTKELADRLNDLNDGFRVKTIDPGVASTDFGENGNLLLRIAMTWRIMKPFARDARIGFRQYHFRSHQAAE